MYLERNWDIVLVSKIEEEGEFGRTIGPNMVGKWTAN